MLMNKSDRNAKSAPQERPKKQNAAADARKGHGGAIAPSNMAAVTERRRIKVGQNKLQTAHQKVIPQPPMRPAPHPSHANSLHPVILSPKPPLALPPPQPSSAAVAGAPAVPAAPSNALAKQPSFQPKVPGFGNEVPRGKNAPPHLNTGQVLNGKFRIEKIIGSGGFGQIYKAMDETTRLSVAIKVVPADHEPGRMILEQKVLILLRGTSHAPHLVASGSFNGLMYIVMEMLGKNLGELRRKRRDRKLSISTVLRVGQQAIAGLKAVHDVGYLHRDVKPSNMCIGFDGTHRRKIYIVDFGMTRQYRNVKGEFRKERVYAGFRGTMRYVSITVHERKEQGPGDDLISLLYTLIELAEGSLPWKQLSDPDDIAQKKRMTTFEDMCRYFPLSTKAFLQHVEKLQYHQMPNYPLLTSILQKALPPEVTNDSPFDWEENPSILKSVEKNVNKSKEEDTS